MKGIYRLYLIVLGVVLALIVFLQLGRKKLIDWSKNYDPTETSPFGLAVFNREAAGIFNNKLQRIAKTPYEFYDKKIRAPHNILIVAKHIDRESWRRIFSQINQGSDAMILIDENDEVLRDSLLITRDPGYRVDSIAFGLTDKKYRPDSLKLKKFPSADKFSFLNKNSEILGTGKYENGDYINFVRLKMGKGRLYLHSDPLFLTNYYLLYGKSKNYTEHIFSYLPERETIWFTDTSENMNISYSPMRFILSQPALKYAWWLFLGGMLIFMIFNAKRRQRTVPVIKPLENKSVDFVKSVGNLYYQEGDFHDMMAKKAQFFLHRLRIDLLMDTKNLDESFEKTLQLKTGQPPEKIHRAIALVQKSTDKTSAVTKEDLIEMNRILDEIIPNK